MILADMEKQGMLRKSRIPNMASSSSKIILSALACMALIPGASGGTFVIWGSFNAKMAYTPANANLVAVASGEQSVVGLTSDGTVLAWGECCAQPRPNQIDSLPALSDISALASGDLH